MIPKRFYSITDSRSKSLSALQLEEQFLRLWYFLITCEDACNYDGRVPLLMKTISQVDMLPAKAQLQVD